MLGFVPKARLLRPFFKILTCDIPREQVEVTNTEKVTDFCIYSH